MDIDILNEFLVLSNTNTFAEAAKILGCSSAGLRTRIASFEEHVGVQLLKRNAHGFELTEAGRKLIPDGRRIAAKYRESIEKGRAMTYKEYHQLNVAFVGLEMPLPLWRRLASFCEKYPEVNIHLMSDSEYAVDEDLFNQTIDLFIVYSGEEPFFEELHAYPLWEAEPYMLISQSHRLSNEKSALIKDFDGECMLLYPRTKVSGLREWQAAVRDDSGMTFFNYRDKGSKEYSKYLLSMGKVIMIYPYSGGALPPETVALPLTDPHIRKLRAYAIYLKAAQNPMLKLFLGELDISALSGTSGKGV